MRIGKQPHAPQCAAVPRFAGRCANITNDEDCQRCVMTRENAQSRGLSEEAKALRGQRCSRGAEARGLVRVHCALVRDLEAFRLRDRLGVRRSSRSWKAREATCAGCEWSQCLSRVCSGSNALAQMTFRLVPSLTSKGLHAQACLFVQIGVKRRELLGRSSKWRSSSVLRAVCRVWARFGVRMQRRSTRMGWAYAHTTAHKLSEGVL